MHKSIKVAEIASASHLEKVLREILIAVTYIKSGKQFSSIEVHFESEDLERKNAVSPRGNCRVGLVSNLSLKENGQD